MPARIEARDTFDTIENEILFTRAALKADEDARELLPETDEWLELVDAARTKDREFRTRDMDAMAARAIANVRLDIACLGFGKDLLHAVGDRKSPRFAGFFPVAPTRWVKQPLDKQLLGVKGWLTLSGEPELDKHRERLSARAAAAGDAQVAVAALAPARGVNWQVRRDLADALTRLRDGLHRALAERATEKALPRDWPDAFFRIEEREGRAPVPAPAPDPGPGGPTT